jgi:hypothetical protein
MVRTSDAEKGSGGARYELASARGWSYESAFRACAFR